MGESPLRLRPLRLGDEDAFLAAHHSMAADDFMFGLSYEAGMKWPAYLDRLAFLRRGIDLPDALVPSSLLMADVGGEIVGRTSIRYALNDFLAREGGHIGYGVVASHRRRGYATEILRQSLVIARAEGLERVLVTCDDDNVGSAAVIERCRGVFESLVDSSEGGPPMRRYWID
jgi:predicted acetyltransferase